MCPHKFLIVSFIWMLICTKGIAGRYKCMSKGFIRLGNSCYLFSSEIATWQEAHFRCRERESQLAVLATQYEDTTVRTYLERSEFAQLARWIGGMWVQDRWVWAAQGNEIENLSSFVSSTVAQLEEDATWMCLFMDPTHRYHWASQNCILQQHYICEAPLTKTKTEEETTSTNSSTGSTEENIALSSSEET